MQEISDDLGGRPDRNTVGRIVQSYLDNDCTVVALQGRQGILHGGRRFKSEVMDALVHIVQDNEQFMLHGVSLYVLLPQTFPPSMTRVSSSSP